MPRRSLAHEQWAETMKSLHESNDPRSAVSELAYFANQILERCGDSDELAAFLDERALKAFESVEAANGPR